ALSPQWEGFASTVLATVATANLTFATVLPKINEEWACCSGRSVMPREVKKEQNTVAGPSRPRCGVCKGCHDTKDHRSDYKHPEGFGQPKNPQQQPQLKKGGGKKKNFRKGKG